MAMARCQAESISDRGLCESARLKSQTQTCVWNMLLVVENQASHNGPKPAETIDLVWGQEIPFSVGILLHVYDLNFSIAFIFHLLLPPSTSTLSPSFCRKTRSLEKLPSS